jgi:hypothetical protein
MILVAVVSFVLGYCLSYLRTVLLNRNQTAKLNELTASVAHLLNQPSENAAAPRLLRREPLDAENGLRLLKGSESIH